MLCYIICWHNQIVRLLPVENPAYPPVCSIYTPFPHDNLDHTNVIAFMDRHIIIINYYY